MLQAENGVQSRGDKMRHDNNFGLKRNGNNVKAPFTLLSPTNLIVRAKFSSRTLRNAHGRFNLLSFLALRIREVLLDFVPAQGGGMEIKMKKSISLNKIDGGVCAAKGFRAAGIHAGIRKNRDKKDLALIASEKRAAAACVYTQNLVKGAPIYVTRDNVADGFASAVICNSGNANTCNANGIEIAEGMCRLTEEYAGIPKNDVVVASTGVIGQPLDLAPIEGGMKSLVGALSENGSDDAANAIMTTDTKKKEIAFSFTIGGKECRIGGIAKGSGMIHPNMATMLVFVTTDTAISPKMLQKALSAGRALAEVIELRRNNYALVIAVHRYFHAVPAAEAIGVKHWLAAVGYLYQLLTRVMFSQNLKYIVRGYLL